MKYQFFESFSELRKTGDKSIKYGTYCAELVNPNRCRVVKIGSSYQVRKRIITINNDIRKNKSDELSEVVGAVLLVPYREDFMHWMFGECRMFVLGKNGSPQIAPRIRRHFGYFIGATEVFDISMSDLLQQLGIKNSPEVNLSRDGANIDLNYFDLSLMA